MLRIVRRLFGVWGGLFPNELLAVGAAAAISAELYLHGSTVGGIFSSDLPLAVFASAAVVWQWILVAWMIHAVGRLTQRFGGGGRHRLGLCLRLASAAGLLLAAGCYSASWILFRQIGRFANLEAGIFILESPLVCLWHYMSPSERTTAVVCAVAAVPTFFAIAWLLPKTARVRAVEGSQQSLSWPLAVALAFCVLWASWQPIANEPSFLKSRTRMQRLSTGLSPGVTLVTSLREALSHPRIVPVLNESQLVRIDPEFASIPSGSRERPSIVIVQVESLRSDIIGRVHQGREVMPHVNALARRSTVFKNAYSQSTHSDYADVCIVSSLYPLRTRHHHYYQREDPWPKTLAFDVVKPAGYATAVISGQNEAWGNMDQFLMVPTLDRFFDAGRSGLESQVSQRDPGLAYEFEAGGLSAGKLHDYQTVDAAIHWLQPQVEASTPFVLSMNLQTSHFPYELPPGADQPFQPCELSDDVTFMYHPPRETEKVWNAYCNALAEADRQIGRLIEFFRACGVLENTIFVVLGENGEAFHEGGTVGHAQAPVEAAVHVALVVYGPRWFSPGVEIEYPIEHIDLLPTIAGRLGWQAHPNWQGIDVLSHSAPPVAERLLFQHTNTGASEVDAVQWAGEWKYLLDRETGLGRLHRLCEEDDGRLDCSGRFPEIARRLRDVLVRWQASQLAYYHHPRYFRRYYPPAAPNLSD